MPHGSSPAGGLDGDPGTPAAFALAALLDLAGLPVSVTVGDARTGVLAAGLTGVVAAASEPAARERDGGLAVIYLGDEPRRFVAITPSAVRFAARTATGGLTVQLDGVRVVLEPVQHDAEDPS